MASANTLSEHDLEAVKWANVSDRQPVMFIHGLWLLAGSWEQWATLFEQIGYATLTPGWPDDPATVAAAHADPSVFARKTVGQIADHFAGLIKCLERKPAVIGHSFGGLVAQILAGRGLASASVAISPVPFRGVMRLPISALRSSLPVLLNPANRNRAVPLTFDQFRYAFANTVSEHEAHELYKTYAVPGAGAPIFQAVTANLNPWSQLKVDKRTPERGPLLIISADSDHTVPWSMANASFKKQKRNAGVTEIVKLEDRCHGLTIDHGWNLVAQNALDFLDRFVPASAS